MGQKKKRTKPKAASREVKKIQEKDFTEDDYLSALDKATERLDQDSSSPGRGSPKRAADHSDG